MGSKPYSNISLTNLQDRTGLHNIKRTRWDSPRSHDRSYTTLALTQSPRNSPSVTPTRNTLRRYSLADVGFMSPSYNERNRLSPLQNVYNTPNLSYACTQIDGKSPGYAGRVVQYNEEAEKSFPIAQSKYNKPGVFPIVHFFKQDLPSPQRKQTNVNVRMHSPELSKFNTPEQNRMLLETIIHSTPANKAISPHNNEVNTKSVLDALKEISRKRIHANEEDYIVNEDGKMTCMDYVSGPNARKKVKLNLSQLENSPNTKNNSNYCSIDELKASFSSMEGQEIKKPRVERSIGTSRPALKNNNQTTHVDVETQTSVETQTTESLAEPKIVSDEKVNLNDTSPEQKIKKVSPVKIFDEIPLETMRKNRLVALMGSLTGETNKENKAQASVANDTKAVELNTSTEKPLVSILSRPAEKSPNKIQKHVTFNLPDAVTTVSSDVSQNSSAQQDTVNTVKQNSVVYDMVTKTSAALTTPIVSSIVTEESSLKKTEIRNESSSQPTTSFSQSKSNGDQLQSTFSLTVPTQLRLASAVPIQSSFASAAPTQSSFTSSVPTQSSFTSAAPSFSLTPPTQPSVISFSATKDQQPQSNRPVTTTSSPSMPAPAFSFAVTSAQKSFAGSSPIQNSGVKTLSVINTNNTATVATTSNSGFGEAKIMPTFSFGSQTITTTPSKSASEDSSQKGGFKFDVKTYTPSAPATFSFGSPSQAVNNPNKTLFNVSTPNDSVRASVANKSTFPQAASSVAATTPNFNLLPLPSTTTAVTTSDSSKSFQLPSANSFSSGTSSNFGSSNAFSASENKFSPAATLTPINFGATANSNVGFSNTFSKPTNALNPITSTSQNPASTTSTFMTSNPLNKSSVFSFGSNPNASANSANPSTPFALGFNSNSSGMFGSVAKSTLGNSSATTTSATPFFGSVTQSTASSETSSTVFNKPVPSFASTNPPFGSVFGTSNNNTGGTTNNANFGSTPSSFNTSNPVFGANNLQVPSNFGGDTPAKPAFGQGTVPQFGATTTTASSVFGGGSTQTFGTSSAFPPTATTTASNIFGGTNPSGFGANSSAPIFGATTTASAPTFGSGAAANFSTSTFGSNATQNPGFNTTGMNPSSSFGNVFGVTTTTTATTADFSTSRPFNQPASNNLFPSFGEGSTLKTNSFETTPFQGATNAFGSGSFSANPPVTQSEIFTFGQNTNKPAVFSFGASEPPKPTFNFTADNTSSNAFGAGNKGFAPAFGATTTPQFNVPPAATGMFNIGTGSSTPSRSRTQLKAKRRT